jgi:YidC/Oxa1 family membrane protein insertase
MSAIQPEIQKLQKKYKDDPRKAQAEQSKLMKERGVSMWGGCLPMLIMMPLFFCFIAAFRFWGYEQMVKLLIGLSKDPNNTKMFESFRFLWVNNIWQPDNGTVPVIMKAQDFLAIKDLPKLIYFQQNPEALTIFKNLGFIVQDTKNIPQAAIDKYNELVKPLLDTYAGSNNGWFIWPLLAGASMFLSSWIMQKGQPQNDAAGGTGKFMVYVFPIMSFFFCLNYNTSFAIYWTISSIVTLGVNLLLNKKYPRFTPEEVKK